MHRLRQAIQFCKAEIQVDHVSDINMDANNRLLLEKCLVQNYLLKQGMDYFGKRDLIYIDMMGDQDIKKYGKIYDYVENPLY